MQGLRGKRILLLLDQRENQELLGSELAREHQVLAGTADSDLEQQFDLCVVDGSSLDRLWQRVSERKMREQPIFLPILLVTSRPGVKMITRHLWRSVDELIITPIEKPELRARVEIMLRARSLSLALRQRAEEAEQATHTRDEVLAMVAHDLRNPLNLILTSGSFLLDTAAQLRSGQREQLQMIHRAAERMTRLIQDLLEVAGMEAGQLVVELGTESVGPLMREACGSLEHAADAKAIRLRLEGEDDLPRIHVDRDRVLQVLGNLIGNALKFTSAGGEVRVAAQRDEDWFGSPSPIPVAASTSGTCRTSSTASGKRSGGNKVGRGSGSRSSAASSKRTAGRSGRKARWGKAARSGSRFPPRSRPSPERPDDGVLSPA
jgi:signal transduction histidine kinase